MIFNEQITFNAPIRLNAGMERTAIKFKRGLVTPDVRFFEFFICDNTAPVTITNFINGADCQSLNILGDGNTTVSHNSNIKTNIGANKLLNADTVYKFTRFNDIWYEGEDKNSGGGGSGAPINAQYLVLAADGTLTNERILQFDTTNYFTVTDGGAGSNYNVVPKTIAGLLVGTYTKLTVDVKGRVTAATNLVAADIPVLDASKITTGTIATARLGSGSASINTYLAGTQTYRRPHMSITLYGSSAEAWVNMANVARGSAQPLYNILNSSVAVADLVGFTEFRWSVGVRVLGGPSAKLFIRASTNGTTWTGQLENAAGTTADLDISSVGPKVSAWTTMDATFAIATAYLQVYGYTGNATADPVFGPIVVEFR